ncbi:hypothetical protein NEAUS04_0660 [Nematocida ausubeli]|uniref:Mitochondrial import inner membrane translocase subunit TIM22 n=1 Tax=Nematocida ausubeli (strain ATCC PRA-371 / ERTm2) TaxID=1913371 RepID=H8ZEY0_NEMA1|nr:uncharacterized protein NESG_01845 [Nematocida ausubeli]EHY64746.1 hypothetical protein NERG_02149 [Nematocida ausubeli]KAI5134508.1 hypothetical protein NEAUS07_0853 [Nematocida ausubeli]KAI5134853.1 hypothetical protein NEAUS06_1354 [Nematocida ausubeli]KAI5147644.1 hypothetical protein NEAUS05_0936 [Nematocida ausubeli]KAI5161685.1 hypothetical protein NEAUS04_0660 [Nematocida ausubeli]
MPHPAEKSRTRELLGQVVVGTMAGAAIGLGIGVLQKGFCRNSSISSRITDTMIIGGSYVLFDNLISKYNLSKTYRPIVAGLAAGSLGSRGGASSIIATSVATACAAYALESADILNQTDVHLE